MAADYIKLISHLGRIGKEKPFKVLIEDPADCDMIFTFSLAEDKAQTRSYTKYEAKDRGHGYITIYNIGKSANVSSSSPIELGTYKNKYRLFAMFHIMADGMDEHQIEVSFYLKEL